MRGGRPTRANREESAIPQLGGDESPDALYAVLAEAGCLVVTDALPAVQCNRIESELAQAMAAAVSIGPGARAQMLHREEGLFPFFPVPRPNLILASMWAINDFTADNGATLRVPGSHRWDGKRGYPLSLSVSAQGKKVGVPCFVWPCNATG